MAVLSNIKLDFRFCMVFIFDMDFKFSPVTLELASEISFIPLVDTELSDIRPLSIIAFERELIFAVTSGLLLS